MKANIDEFKKTDVGVGLEIVKMKDMVNNLFYELITNLVDVRDKNYFKLNGNYHLDHAFLGAALTSLN